MNYFLLLSCHCNAFNIHNYGCITLLVDLATLQNTWLTIILLFAKPLTSIHWPRDQLKPWNLNTNYTNSSLAWTNRNPLCPNDRGLGLASPPETAITSHPSLSFKCKHSNIAIPELFSFFPRLARCSRHRLGYGPNHAKETKHFFRVRKPGRNQPKIGIVGNLVQQALKLLPSSGAMAAHRKHKLL